MNTAVFVEGEAQTGNKVFGLKMESKKWSSLLRNIKVTHKWINTTIIKLQFNSLSIPTYMS